MSLTALQWKFIGARLLTATDKEAAEQIGISVGTPGNWKQLDPEFVREYEAAFVDGVHVAQEYTRKLLGKAAQRLDEALDATRTVAAELRVEFFNHGKRCYVPITEPDHKARIEAAKLLFQAHGLLKERVDIEVRIRQAAEAMGLDPEAAIAEAKEILSLASTRRT